MGMGQVVTLRVVQEGESAGLGGGRAVGEGTDRSPENAGPSE